MLKIQKWNRSDNSIYMPTSSENFILGQLTKKSKQEPYLYTNHPQIQILLTTHIHSVSFSFLFSSFYCFFIVSPLSRSQKVKFHATVISVIPQALVSHLASCTPHSSPQGLCNGQACRTHTKHSKTQIFESQLLNSSHQKKKYTINNRRLQYPSQVLKVRFRNPAKLKQWVDFSPYL